MLYYPKFSVLTIVFSAKNCVRKDRVRQTMQWVGCSEKSLRMSKPAFEKL